jgi:hypothetical protein
MLATVVSTNSLEITGLSRHRCRTTNLMRCPLLNCGFLGWSIEDNNGAILLCVVVFDIGHFTLPGCIGQPVTLFIWLAKTVHLDRIGEAGRPHSITNNFHLLIGYLRVSSPLREPLHQFEPNKYQLRQQILGIFPMSFGSPYLEHL